MKCSVRTWKRPRMTWAPCWRRNALWWIPSGRCRTNWRLWATCTWMQRMVRDSTIAWTAYSAVARIHFKGYQTGRTCSWLWFISHSAVRLFATRQVWNFSSYQCWLFGLIGSTLTIDSKCFEKKKIMLCSHWSYESLTKNIILV